jgi:cytochrome c oxidase subunit 4
MSSAHRTYVYVLAALLALLVLTVGAAYIHFGAFNTVVAMVISLTKGLLIVLFFMHLKRAEPLIRLFACAGFFWLLLLLALALSDFLTRG